VVTDRLPNGNFVIAGRQEVRVNSELRELRIAGVIRPEDISSRNTIDYFKVAEARIAYGGRGTISRVQKPRYGQRLYEFVVPF
jgi:flagellar L-ring protein precursor FlgH